jgi:hypothetical protein
MHTLLTVMGPQASNRAWQADNVKLYMLELGKPARSPKQQ